jgi:hypothetical protein
MDEMKPFAEPIEGREAGKLWTRRIDAAVKWRLKHPYADSQWKRNVKLDRGLHWNEDHKAMEASSDDPRPRITVNLVASNVRDFIAFLLKNTPKFIAKPRRPEDVKSARVQQELVNYFWREKKWKKQARRAVRDLVTLGTSIMRTGWVLELDASAQPDEHGQLEYNDAVRKDEPLVRRVNPAKFLIDPMAPDHDLESARWVAEIFRKPLTDVLANQKYDPEVISKIEAGEYTPTKISREDKGDKDRDADDVKFMATYDDLSGEEAANTLVRIYEVWDKKFQRHYILLDGVKEPLVAENWPYPHLDGFPYVLATYDELNDEMYGLGLPWAMEDQQLELNRIRTAEFEHRRNFGQQRLALNRNAISETELAKLQTGSTDDVVVDGPDAIKPIEYPQLPPDNYQVEGIIKEDIRNLIGADQLTQGGNLPGRTSATEVNTRSGYTGMKIDMRVDAVDTLLTEVTSQVLKHMKAYMDQPTAIRIQGSMGNDWAMVNKEDIRADTDLEIITVSAERTDPTVERQQATNVLDKLLQAMPLLQQVGYTVNVPRVLEWVLGEKFEVREYNEFVVPLNPSPVDPNAQGMNGAGVAAPPGIPPQQQAAQMNAARPESAVMGALLGGG